MGWIINSTENPWLRHRMPRFYIHIQLQINWINDHNRHKVSVWVCHTCTCRAFLCHCCLVRHQSHWLCLCCVDRKEAASVGRLWRQQLTQETTGRTGAGGGGGGWGQWRGVRVAGDPIKIFDKHCSTPRQETRWIHMTQSAKRCSLGDVVLPVAWCQHIKIFKAVLDHKIRNLLLI